MLTFSSKNLSEDCTRVVPGGDVRIVDMDPATAVLRLRAFASQVAVDLVNSDALIYLSNADFKLAVQNENGRLYAKRVPAAANDAAVEQTPEEIVRFLDRKQAAANQVPQPQVPERARARARRPWRHWFNSRWLAGILAVVTAVLAYFSFSSDAPEGVKMINDPSRVASLQAKFNGRYGETISAGTAVLVVENGRFAVYPAGAKGAPGEALLDSSYRYGLRGDQIVLVVANGAVLETEPKGGLRFNDAVYPRIPPH